MNYFISEDLNVLCVIDSLGSGGAQRQLVELARGFKARNHQVHFLTYYTDSFFYPQLEKAGITVTCIQGATYITRLLKIRQFIRHGDYDAVISFLEGANFFCEVAGIPFRKWKLVVGERIADPQILKLPKLIIYRWFHFFADYIVGNSKANLELVRLANPFLRRSKCKLIYNIIDFQKWKPTTDYQPRQNSKIKLIIGSSHCYRKNLVGFVKALLLLSKQELNEFTVDWYGDRLTEPYYDNSYAEARKIIEENGLENIISFFPATHEIHQRVQESDVVGLFSFAEGFPNIICEGMACAKPVICSAISDVPEIISDDSRLLLFNPGDPQSIKEAISYLLSLDNKQLIKIGLKNQRKAKDLFEKEFIISSYLDLLGK